jgi:cobaltochelatase CobS
MMMRANMDSAIERPDFVGAMSVTTDDDGNQITQFVDGFLPKAMQLPVVMLLDEYDAIRADISYVMQPVLEGGALRLLEDGGRMVHPHPDFHIMATANTVGTGDSSGLYASAVKVQSRASINRFPVFIKVDYLSSVEEMALVKKFAPQLSSSAYNMLCDFVTHYRAGFADGTIATPISPRNTITIGKYVADFEGRLGTTVAVKRALEMNVMNTIDEGDSIAVTGIMDRISN